MLTPKFVKRPEAQNKSELRSLAIDLSRFSSLHRPTFDCIQPQSPPNQAGKACDLRDRHRIIALIFPQCNPSPPAPCLRR